MSERLVVTRVTHSCHLIQFGDLIVNAEEAAELTAALRPKLAVPQHYAFTGGTVGDTLFLKSDKYPAHFVEAARRLAPDVPVKVISPGESLTVAP